MTRLGPSKIHGTGVFAERGIIRGEFIGTAEGQVTADTKELFAPHNLCIPDGRGRSWILCVDAPFRYLNHADTPNCVLDGPNLYALRRIKAGEELTIDYGASDETERPKAKSEFNEAVAKICAQGADSIARWEKYRSGGENGTEDETDGC